MASFLGSRCSSLGACEHVRKWLGACGILFIIEQEPYCMHASGTRGGEGGGGVVGERWAQSHDILVFDEPLAPNQNPKP